MKINVHAGHNPDGKKACGAVGLIKESTEARAVKDEVVDILRQLGHTVYDCTCNNGTSQADVLTKIVKLCNDHEVDLDVSIHFNAGAKDKGGNGRTTGTEVLVYSTGGGAYSYAEKIAKAIEDLGFRNRGVKIRPDLYVLRKTKAPALLIECCFVDDKDDVKLYDSGKMARAIVQGITGMKFSIEPSTVPPKTSQTNTIECKPFLVRVTCDGLYVRKGAGENYPTAGAITDKGTYTIVATNKAGTWGKLKSGAGWISLNEKYVTKV